MTSLHLMIFTWSMVGSAGLIGSVWGVTALCVRVFLGGDWMRLDEMLGYALE